MFGLRHQLAGHGDLSVFLIQRQEKAAVFSTAGFYSKLFVVLFVGPLFVSPFVAQLRFELPGLDWIGSTLSWLLFASGLVIILFAFFKIGVVPSLKEKSQLITDGVYRIVRHPIYSGTVFAYLGLILLTKAFISLLYLPLSIALYFLMTIYEERSLVSEYGQAYVEYRKRVRNRVIPFVL